VLNPPADPVERGDAAAFDAVVDELEERIGAVAPPGGAQAPLPEEGARQ
jgi:hypothetical protein